MSRTLVIARAGGRAGASIPARRPGLGLLALALALASLVLAALPAAAAPTFPALTGRVVDNAHVLSPQAAAEIDRSLTALEAKTSRQLVVVTLPSLQGYDIADYGYQLGRAWGVGQKQTNNGALFIVAPNERKVRIEVGYGLEGVLTDAMSNVILQRAVLPRFKAGDMEGGVVAGTRALVEQLSLDTSTAEQRAAKAAQAQAERNADQGRSVNPLVGVVVLFVILWVIGGIFRGGGAGWFLPGLILGNMLGGGRRGWDDDGWGGRGGGGGFGGGGGGSFGGGGSSGSW